MIEGRFVIYSVEIHPIPSIDTLLPAPYALIDNNPELFPEGQNLITKKVEESRDILFKLPIHRLP
ncbi:hypothetical protein A3A55_02295 [Candidatus Roizmanbacteria bacterium RIFCSPLOWO2_01_FULL_40_14]|nr:MAG: hypothetical protein A3A55_02295 [Candidatus Roizmanbacteria bacterium RIFCSPLOWO2_01_FULL_40_14]